MFAIFVAAAFVSQTVERSPLFFDCQVDASMPYRMEVSLSLRPGYLNAVTMSERFRSSSAAVTMDDIGWHWEDYRHNAYGTNHIDRRTLAYWSEGSGQHVRGQCQPRDSADLDDAAEAIDRPLISSSDEES